jgi:hypothetical protein
MEIRVSGSSSVELVSCLCRFLDKDLPAEVVGPSLRGDDWFLSGTIFLDFVPVSVEVCIVAEASDSSIIVLKHPSRNDAMRFHHFFKLLIHFLGSFSFKVMSLHQAGSDGLPGQAALIHDDFSDFASEDTSWDDKVECMLADARSRNMEIREEALRSLARWSSSTQSDEVEAAPESHEQIAQGFVEEAVLFEEILFSRPPASLAERYPVAAALRSIAGGSSSKARATLSKSSVLSSIDKQTLSQLPTIVARELSAALRALQMDKVSNPNTTERDFASVSTKCTDLGSLQFLSESSADSDTDSWDLDSMPCEEYKLIRCSDDRVPPGLLEFCKIADSLFVDCTNTNNSN